MERKIQTKADDGFTHTFKSKICPLLVAMCQVATQRTFYVNQSAVFMSLPKKNCFLLLVVFRKEMGSKLCPCIKTKKFAHEHRCQKCSFSLLQFNKSSKRTIWLARCTV